MSMYREYADYLCELREVANGAVAAPENVSAHLNGKAAVALSETFAINERRRLGAFFTPGPIRERVTEFLRVLDCQGPFLDAACGAGDLLLAAFNSMSPSVRGRLTTDQLSDMFLGCDTQAEFVESARLRLQVAFRDASSATLAASLGRVDAHSMRTSEPIAPVTFNNLRAADGIMTLREKAPFAGTIVLNPPFGSMKAPTDCSWGAGLVPRAGVFMEAAARALGEQSYIVAILPDVLRSGSRLRRWRSLMESLIEIQEIEVTGRFDARTDVDVFILVGRRRIAEIGQGPEPFFWTEAPNDTHATASLPVVDDFFDVHVGSVVDNRDLRQGPERSFVTARSIPKSGVLSRIVSRRQFEGTVREPPFVLVRRTNRPTEGARRALGLIVTGKRPVAIDNHLLVALPKDGSVEACIALCNALDDDRVDAFLDQRIRCRHLTVQALREVPLPGWSLARRTSSRPIKVLSRERPL